MAKKPMKKTVKKGAASMGVKKIQPPVLKEPLNKTQVMKYLAEMGCLTKAQINHLMDALSCVIESHLKKRMDFNFLGLAKFRVIRKPATKARKGVNPFTGEPTTFAAKPARNVVKVKPLKKLKDSVL
jgi:nucleoid DNA-binding protein